MEGGEAVSETTESALEKGIWCNWNRHPYTMGKPGNVSADNRTHEGLMPY
jgi:hypothetical protein